MTMEVTEIETKINQLGDLMSTWERVCANGFKASDEEMCTLDEMEQLAQDLKYCGYHNVKQFAVKMLDVVKQTKKYIVEGFSSKDMRRLGVALDKADRAYERLPRETEV